MTDEIEQLLRNLHLKKIAAIMDDELAHAEKHQLSYGAFLARLLRAQYIIGKRPPSRGGSSRRDCPRPGRLNPFPSSGSRASTPSKFARWPNSSLSPRPKTWFSLDTLVWGRPDSPPGSCSRPFRTAIEDASFERRISSTRCVPRSLIDPRVACSTR